MTQHEGEQNRLMIEARLRQLEQTLDALSERDFAQELADATAAINAAKTTLDYFTSKVLTGVFAPTDTALLKIQVWLAFQKTLAHRADVLTNWVQAVETELQTLSLRRQLQEYGAVSESAGTALDVRTQVLQAQLQGSPTNDAQIAKLEQQHAQLQTQPHWGPFRHRWYKRLQALEEQITTLRAQGRGLRGQLADAQQALATIQPHLNEGETELLNALHTHQADLNARLPTQQDALARLRIQATVDPTVTPALIATLDRLATVLGSHNPDDLLEIFAQLEASAGGATTAWVSTAVRTEVVGLDDPRLIILTGRERFATMEMRSLSTLIVNNLVAIGLDPHTANQLVQMHDEEQNEVTHRLQADPALSVTFFLFGMLEVRSNSTLS